MYCSKLTRLWQKTFSWIMAFGRHRFLIHLFLNLKWKVRNWESPLILNTFCNKADLYIIAFTRPQIYIQMEYNKSPNSKPLEALKSISSMHKMITSLFFTLATIEAPILTHQDIPRLRILIPFSFKASFSFLQCPIYATVRLHNPQNQNFKYHVVRMHV